MEQEQMMLRIQIQSCHLIEYSSNYSETTGSLWFYSEEDTIDFNADIANNNSFKFLEYKVKLLETTVAQIASNVANEIQKKKKKKTNNNNKNKKMQQLLPIKIFK